MWLGGDSAASTNWTIDERKSPKVFRASGLLIGTAGSVRIANLVRYSLCVSKRPADMDAEEYMVTWVIDALRRLLKDHGASSIYHNAETAEAHMLIGYAGRLFSVHGDYQVGEPAQPLAAIGSGAEVALGALWVTRDVRDPHVRLTTALSASASLTPYVRAPFTIRGEHET